MGRQPLSTSARRCAKEGPDIRRPCRRDDDRRKESSHECTRPASALDRRRGRRRLRHEILAAGLADRRDLGLADRRVRRRDHRCRRQACLWRLYEASRCAGGEAARMAQCRRRRHRQDRGRARALADPRHRQAAARGDLRGQAGRGLHPRLRRAASAYQRRGSAARRRADRRRPFRLHHAHPLWRGRRDHPVQRAGEPPGAEDRAGASRSAMRWW